MSELQVFSNAEFGSVRSITVNGEPYFVGKDVAEILGYANTRDALAKHVDEEDRMDGVAIRDSIGSPSGDPQAWRLPDGRYREQHGCPD